MTNKNVFIIQFNGKDERQAVITATEHLGNLLETGFQSNKERYEDLRRFVEEKTSTERVPNPNTTTPNTTTMYEITYYVFKYPRNKDGSPNMRYKINRDRNQKYFIC